MRGWTVALFVVGLGSPSELAAWEPSDPLTIQVLALNQAGVPHGIVARAEQEATRIFSAIGIRLDWNNVVPDSPEPYRDHPLKITIMANSRLKGSARRLGVAERLRDNVDMRAYAFYWRIEDLAHRNGTDLAQLLGHVLAHEIGHLLLPYGSHSSRGVMREELDRTQLEGIRKGLLAFSGEQAMLIRMRVGQIRMK